MSHFEFLFALFGLLLGLSLATVLSGLALTIDARLRPGATMRVGWLTPLLGLFVLLDLLSFWAGAWLTRDIVSVNLHALLAVMVFAGAYYLAAALVFPREPGEHDDLDDHFFRVRRIVIGVLLVLLLCQLSYYATIAKLQQPLTQPFSVVMTLVLIALMIAAMIVRTKRWAVAVMVALVLRYVTLYLL